MAHVRAARSPITSDVESTASHAVVVGGSTAGLFAARVLADHFARVTIVDRDRFPEGPEFRKGVPQSRQLHTLLRRGLDIAGHYFPGIEHELVAAGGVPANFPGEAIWLTPRGWAERITPGIRFVSCHREVLEWVVRRRVAALANVTIVDGHEVTGLIGSADGRAIEGVRLRARPGATGGETELRAGIVIDASGRNSRASEWLVALGYDRPREERINAFLGYASRDYSVPDGIAADCKVIIVQAKRPRDTRYGFFFQIAPDRWRLSLMGAARDYQPTEEEGFLAFVRSLRSPVISDAVSRARPLTPIHGYQQTENLRRHFDRLRRIPERFLVTGDALCAFNPVYGQGMTAAAQAALVLDRLLDDHKGDDLAGFGKRVHRAVAKANAGAWLIAAGEDLRFPTTEGGKRDLPTRLSHRYFDRSIRASLDNPRVLHAFIDVMQLVNGPASLFKPAVLIPALLRGGRPDLELPSATAPSPDGRMASSVPSLSQ